MTMNEASILAVSNPFMLLAGGGLVCLLSYICARRYRSTNDFAKSVKMFVPLVLVLDLVLLFFLQIDFILTAGLNICGFIVLALISNYYFYH